MRRYLLLLSLLSVAGCQWGLTRKVDYNLPPLANLTIGATTSDAAGAFAQEFCGTLRHLDPSSTEWGECSAWIHTPVTPAQPIASPIPKTYGVVVVAGIFSQCIQSGGVHIFQPGIKHLQDDHGLVAQEVVVSGVGSSGDNAIQIEKFFESNPGEFIAIGYSKGVADLMEAIQSKPHARSQIKALISVAGAVGGSRLADIPGPEAISAFESVIKKTGLGSCDIQDAGGLRSLTRKERYDFLAKWTPPADLKTFSLVGVTKREDTSKVLQLFWDRVSYYSIDEDSQVVADEGVLPGARFLGRARGDHWAVALPFWETGDQKVRQNVDKNRFPRTALLEALVREVYR